MIGEQRVYLAGAPSQTPACGWKDVLVLVFSSTIIGVDFLQQL